MARQLMQYISLRAVLRQKHEGGRDDVPDTVQASEDNVCFKGH